MSYIVVDVEADGPFPEQFSGYSIVCFGAIVVEPTLSKTFYGAMKPISHNYIPDALAVSNITREQHQEFEEPLTVMRNFRTWIKENSVGNPIFVSDNPAFDWQWINYYFHKFLNENPFGFSGRRIGDLYCGMLLDAGANNEWKRKFRKTKHTHNPVDDAKGNAEALLAFQDLGLKIKLL